VSPPTFDDADITRASQMLHAILVATGILFAYLLCIQIPLLAGNKLAGYMLVSLWLLFWMLAWQQMGAGQPKVAATVHCAGFSIAAITLTLLAPPVQIAIMLPATMHIAVLHGARAGVVAALASIAIAAFVAAGGSQWIGLPVVFPALPPSQVGILVVLLVLTIVPVFFYMKTQRDAMTALKSELAMRELAEAALREANENLETTVEARTEQLRAANVELNAFAQRAAHDLRGAIGQVSGYMSLVGNRQCVIEDEKAQRYAKRAEDAGKRLSALVDSLLALATLDAKPLTWRPIDLSDVIAEQIEGQRLNHPDRKVEVECPPLGIVWGDPALITNVLQNLLGNAFKFTRDREHARIIISTSLSDDGLWRTVHIRDNGAGFPMSDADRLFGGFQRLHTSSQFEGHGIGLASCKKIIHLHGGDISAEGMVGVGATITFALPAQRPIDFVA
jgi:signal transduction histidine kinase